VSGDPSPHSLAVSCAVSPAMAEEVLSVIAAVAALQEQRVRRDFCESLSDFDRAVFERQREIPYNERDWWRDPHDIYVTRCMALILERENKARTAAGRSDLLPQWLTTAALIHDRGYALLGRFPELAGAEYLMREGAHWEGGDTRIAHARLSRRYAGGVLFGIVDTELEKMVDISALEAANPIDAPEVFLQVVETHDYPFVGRYQEMSLQARHHFDADSLFSISVLSFVKDYLAYLRDATKVRAALDHGLGSAGVFTPRSLLQARMSRYFEVVSQLPAGWDLARFPLTNPGVSFVEGGCIRPHSATALELTEVAFEELARCCIAMEDISSVEQFGEWIRDSVGRQFDALF
jgi:hypothetical protein